MTTLQHVTLLNTGNLVPSPRDQVLPKTMRWLAPMVHKGRDELAGMVGIEPRTVSEIMALRSAFGRTFFRNSVKKCGDSTSIIVVRSLL